MEKVVEFMVDDGVWVEEWKKDDGGWMVVRVDRMRNEVIECLNVRWEDGKWEEDWWEEDWGKQV